MHFGAGLVTTMQLQIVNPENLPVESVATTDPFNTGTQQVTKWRLAPNGTWVSMPGQEVNFSSLARLAQAVKVISVKNPLTGEQLYPPPAKPAATPGAAPESAPQTAPNAPGTAQALTPAQAAVQQVVEAATPPPSPWPTWKKAAVIGGSAAVLLFAGFGLWYAVKR